MADAQVTGNYVLVDAAGETAQVTGNYVLVDAAGETAQVTGVYVLVDARLTSPATIAMHYKRLRTA